MSLASLVGDDAIDASARARCGRRVRARRTGIRPSALSASSISAPASQQPMTDNELGLGIVFNGCIYNFRELRAELQAQGLSLLLRRRHRSHPESLSRLGRGLRAALQGHVRLCAVGARQRPRRAGARPSRHQAALLRRRPRLPPLRLDPAGAARGRRHRHLARSGRRCIISSLPRRGAGAAHHPEWREEASRPPRS